MKAKSVDPTPKRTCLNCGNGPYGSDTCASEPCEPNLNKVHSGRYHLNNWRPKTDKKEQVSYKHINNDETDIRFVQYKEDPLPKWATDVQPYTESDVASSVQQDIIKSWEIKRYYKVEPSPLPKVKILQIPNGVSMYLHDEGQDFNKILKEFYKNPEHDIVRIDHESKLVEFLMNNGVNFVETSEIDVLKELKKKPAKLKKKGTKDVKRGPDYLGTSLMGQ